MSSQRFANPGELVTGYDAEASLWVREGCRWHVWRVLGRPRRVSRKPEVVVQRAECLVCEYRSEPVSASWWQQRAELDYIHRTLRLVHTERKRLRAVQSRLMEVEGEWSHKDWEAEMYSDWAAQQ